MSKPTKEQLEKINKFTRKELSEDDVYVFPNMMIDNEVTSYYTIIHENLLRKFSNDVRKGVGLILSHDSSKLPVGRSFDSMLVEEWDEETNYVIKSLYGDFYIALGRNTESGMTTDDIVKGIDTGTIFDTSIGFSAKTMECSVCGLDIRRWECPHYPGREYIVENEDGVGETVTCYGIIGKDGVGELIENSLVYAGACTRARIVNKYRFVFTTKHWDYNWDYAEIPWIRLTNWLCDDVTVVPYCEPGGGDKCVEALIGCILGLVPRKKGCVIVRYINQNTGEIIKHVKHTGYSEGNYTFHAEQVADFEIVGDSEKTVYVKEIGAGDVDKCEIVDFYYRRLYRDCVWVIHKDIATGNVLLKETYSNLAPKEYTFYSKKFSGYRLIGENSQSILIEYLYVNIGECKIIIFEYEPEEEPDEELECVWVIYREKDNPDNVLATEQFYNLEPGTYTYYAREFEWYRLVGDEEIEVSVEINQEECKIVIFEYEKIKPRCVVVKFIDIVNEIILDTDYYYNLLPGEYTYYAKEFEDYKLVDEEEKTILLIEEDGECEEVIFEYEPLVEGCEVGKKIWLFT